MGQAAEAQRAVVRSKAREAAEFHEERLSEKALERREKKGLFPSTGDAFVTFARVMDFSSLPNFVEIEGRRCRCYGHSFVVDGMFRLW